MRPVRALVVAERVDSIVKHLPPLPEAIQVTACDTAEAALPLAATADVLCCWGAGPLYVGPVLAAARHLKWIQSLSVGVETLVTLPQVQSGELLLASARGVNAEPIAEQVLAYILSFARNLPAAIRAQARGTWERRFGRSLEVAGSTLGLLGLGAIAEAVAWRARGLGMRVIGTRRRPEQPLPANVDALTDLDGVLSSADYVVVCLPLTPETRGLLGAERLARFKPGALLINVSRGPIVDEDALAAAIEAGHLGGAALDVFATEPLPESSPLWRLPQVIITPHVAADSPHTMRRTMALFADNLLRFSRGEPLLHLVDKHLGY